MAFSCRQAALDIGSYSSGFGHHFTFAQIGLLFVEEFHQHLNCIDTNVKFTIAEQCDGRLPFSLDTLVHPGPSSAPRPQH